MLCGTPRVTPCCTGRCHKVTEGTGDRWEASPTNAHMQNSQIVGTAIRRPLISEYISVFEKLRADDIRPYK